MTWKGLEEMIPDCLRYADRIQADGKDLREQAAELSLAAFGYDVLATPALINVAGLALAMKERLIVHQLSAGAKAHVHWTDLRSIPGQPPALLRDPFLITTRKAHKGETLFGNVAQIGGYWVDDTLFLVLLGYPDGAYVFPWRPVWQESDIDDIDFGAGLLGEDISYQEWEHVGHQAVRFVLMLGLLLEAEGSPVVIDREPRSKTAQQASTRRRRSSKSSWLTRRVYVDGKIRYRSRPPADGVETGTKRERDDLQEVTVMVRGYIRRQRYGPNNSLQKLVYVQSYEARRWVVPKPLRIDVASLSERRASPESRKKE